MSTRYYEFGPFQIDRLNHALRRDGKNIPLKPKVFDTLLLLVENHGRVVDKDEMLQRLWPDTVVEESNLSQNVYLLRRVLEEETDGQRYIETVPKRGYRFVATVTEVETEARRISMVQTRTPRLWKPGIAALIGLLLIGLGSAFIWSTKRPNSPEPTAPINSIAVLPFKSFGSDASDENLGFWMADTLITKLSNVKRLVVRPISSVRKFTSTNEDAVAAGRELKVDAVLDASIQRTGDRIRVTMRLVNVKDGAPLWTRIVDEQVSDPFAVQDRVAEQVTEALALRLTSEEKNLVAKYPTQNSEAYRLCMLGRYYWGRPDVENWKKAIDYFNAAIEKDSNYALAYAGLADSYLSLVADSVLPKPEAIPKAKRAAMTALQLDSSLPEAHVALARIKMTYDWEWTAAENELKRALELNPNSGDAHREYAGYLTNVGQNEQAIAEAKLARQLDPLTQLTNFQFVWSLIGARRYDEAISECQPMLAMFPRAHFWLGMAYLGNRMNEQAIKEFEETLRSAKDHPLAKAALGYAYGATGQREQANKILAEFKQLYEQHQTSPYYLAMIYAGLSDKDQTFAWLEESYREHSRPLASGIKANPMWDSLRSDPRLGNLLGRMGLTQ
jgi:DNA-binding winged helix-turn-helix (wHTH) protein/TolB-like protein/Tfp pilus assembly protein PilF